MNRTRSQRGALSSTLLLAIVIAIVIVIALFFLLRDQGKDDKKNRPGMLTPYSVTLG
jgi:preprotein translocase subunit YajC